jgi:hypothetical protein
MKLLLFAFVAFLLSSSITMGQELILKLNPSKKTAVDRDYQLEKIIDSRQKQSIGEVYDLDRNRRVATYGGKLAEQALAFYKSRVTASPNPSYKFQLKIYSLDQKEVYQTAQKGYKGEVQLGLGLFLLGGNQPVHLVDFNGKATYGRPANQMQNVEISIQTLFENSWEFFDKWLSSQLLSNRSLAKKVRLNILDPKRPSNKDTVFYDSNRPLTWADFRDSPDRTSSFNAAIFSSFSIEGNASVQDAEVVQTIEIKVYMIPSQSWVKKADDYANNHEQRHFDLTRIAANRMIQRLENMNLDPDLFDANLNDIYLDAYREMNKLQEKYDKQTNNGLNKESQVVWNEAISKALLGEMENLDKLLNQ